MPKNIIICCDGTNNQFGSDNTNVVRLIQVLRRDSDRQCLYYDPGVGTLPEPGFVTAIGKKISDLSGLAFGGGLNWKVQQAYCYLMNTWEPGDQVFLFGFSRGAYTARVLAGLLHALGLIADGNQNLVPYVMRLFESARTEREKLDGDIGPWQKLCASFRWTFSRPVFDGDTNRRFLVHFLGVWDTVSSVGWIWDPKKFPYTATNPSVKIVRHAVAIDERRWFFRQNLIKKASDQDHKELWFAGVHCDIGGGYPEIFSEKTPVVYSGLWRIPFIWMVTEAKSAGLLIDDSRFNIVTERNPACASPWREAQHESLTKKWWIAEVVPKHVWNSALKCLQWRIGFWGHRHIPKGAQIHESVLRRIQDPSLQYSPTNLPQVFQEKVRALQSIPESFPL